MKTLFIVLAIVIPSVLTKAYPQSPDYKNISIYPVNEVSSEKRLTAFTDKLIEACNKKDTLYLLSIIDDDVVISHGGGIYGKDAFRIEFLKYFNGFERLKRAISLGGTIEEGEENPKDPIYLYPYLHSGKLYSGKADTIEFDPYLMVVGLTNEVPVHAHPSGKSKVKAMLPYPLLKIDPNNDFSQDKWYKISTFDNKLSGYVEMNQLYYLADIAVNIKRKGDSFSIVSVAPYD